MNKKEILELIKILIEMNNWLIEARAENSLANHIQFPKIPSLMSESLAINLLQDKIILREREIADFQFGAKMADIIGIAGNKQMKIEVKTTAADFQYFGKKDINADYLIWIDLKNPLRNKSNKITIYIVENPSTFFKNPRNIMLKRFLEIATPEIYEIDLIEYLENIPPHKTFK